jgi:hypothetical protein
MYALKSMATAEGREPSKTAPDFSKSFVDNIHKYGRSFEVGLAAKHYLRHAITRLPSMATSGIGMVTKGRMGFRPHRIDRVEGLNAILERASQIEAAKQREAATRRSSGGTH